jgi:hypothetical protein
MIGFNCTSLQLQPITTAHNQWLSKTRSIPYWTTSVFSSTLADLVLIYEPVTSSARSKRNDFREMRTQGNYEPRIRLVPAGRRMTLSTKVARRRGHDHKRRDQDNVVQTFGKRRGKGPECNNGIRDRGLRQELRGSKRIRNQGTRRQLRLKI